jgi:hypothetical protein
MLTLPNKTILMANNTLSRDTLLRKFLICPALVDNYFNSQLGLGIGFLTILDHCKNNDPHIVIYSEYVEQFNLWSKHLTKLKIPNFQVRGGMTPQQIRAQIDAHANYKHINKPSVLLMSIKAAESFDCNSPETGYFLGFCWNKNYNIQAEGRLTRGDKPFCNFYYLVHKDTLEESQLDILNVHSKNTDLVGVDND